jgi:hypothetical protein
VDRPWQPKVVKDILDLVKSGRNRVILNAPTGSVLRHRVIPRRIGKFAGADPDTLD